MRTRQVLLVVCWLMLGRAMAAEYEVSPSGNDASAGTKAAPWQTLAKASAVAAPGDTVYLGAGTYRETIRPVKSGEAGKPIRFVAVPGERPVLSGAEALAGPWQLQQGSIYKLQTNLKFIQLFVDGKMMPEARWPNTPPGDLMAYNRGTAGDGTGYEILADAHLPPGDWNGGIVLLWPGSRWVSNTRKITDYQPGKSLRFDTTLETKTKDAYHKEDPYKPRAGNPYLLMGTLAGLDSPGEWFLDHATGTVYLWTFDNKSPTTHAVEVKQRDYAADLSQRSCIELKGVDIFGAAVKMTDSQGCLLEDCRLRYVEHVREYEGGKLPPVRNVITGKNNEWRRCLIYGAATTGLQMAGEDNRLTNSIIHDVNYTGSGRGGVDLTKSVGAVVSHCTISRTGRDNIQHHSSKRIRIEYCDIYHTNMLNADSGAIYAWGTDGEGGSIAYNWVHDNLGDSTVGIYLDNFDKNFIVHHNLVWNCTGSGIRLNSDALSHLICHNTIQQVREPFGTYCYAAYVPTMKGTRIINNLVNEAMKPTDSTQFVQGELGPELHHNGPGAVDQDACPVAGSAAVDAGVEIAGFTDGFQGQAPDLGAYELGGIKWTAGADWKDTDAPAAPARSLAYAPHPPITEQNMITEGLALWLDAADKATLDVTADATVSAWRDKSPHKRIALPALPNGSVKWVENAMNGKPVLRGNGTGSLRVADLKGELKPVTVFVVSQALHAVGPNWQRIIASFTGVGQEWVLPNWMINAPGHAQPATWPAQVFMVQQRAGAALGTITVLGASAAQGQSLGGDVAEALVFDRPLRFDESEAISNYLKTKWGLK
ncbi:MAG: right-handed parallel beta-helix repeat-containing protein [Planctomycetota bacterium]|nr:right-handed parallel beta-helix repeat-containing protein [Planctomycetota bacterium]